MTGVPLLWVAGNAMNRPACLLGLPGSRSENELQGTRQEAGSVAQPTADGSPGSGQQRGPQTLREIQEILVKAVYPNFLGFQRIL